MKKSVFLLALFFASRFVSAQYYDPGIGDTINALHYIIALYEIDTDEKTIDAYTEVKLTPLINNLDYIPLELKDLTVDSVWVDGSARSFSHNNDIIRVDLLDDVSEDDTLTVGVFYHGHPFNEAWGGFHFSGDYAFNLGVGFESIPHNLGKTWFPCVDDFTDRATYEFFISADKDKKAICGGYFMGKIIYPDGPDTWIWIIDQEIPTYLASVAVGDYVLTQDYHIGIEDSIPITIYTRPSEESNVEGTFVNLKTVIDWFEQRFGAYPFSRVGYTGTAIGAMEHATNIAFPHFAINGSTNYEALYVHELSHMWFGDKVTCSSAEDMWLNEGWATFCEILYLDSLYGYQAYRELLRHEHREVLRTTHIVDGDYYALNNIPQEITYGRHAYNKGGIVADALRGYLGDSIFFDAMTAYLDHYAYQSVSSEEMRDLLSDETGIDMTGFFDTWVFTPGSPHYSIDSVKVTEGDASFMVDVWMKQKFKGADFLGDDIVVEVTFADENFKLVSDTVHFSGETGHSVKYLSFEPKAVFVDLYEKHLDATTDSYRFFTEPEEYAYPENYFKLIIDQLTDSAMLQVTHNWVAPDGLKTPVEGLTLSPYRYWKVDGIMPGAMLSQGRFTYDRGGYLDNDLILSDNDSVVILYREGTGDDWKEVDQTRFGTWNFGYIDVLDLQLGEYTLAVWDKMVVGTEDVPQQDKVLIYPNPTRGVLNFEFKEKSRYTITLYDAKGTLLDQFYINSRSRSWKWKGQHAFSGVVFVHVHDGHDLVTIKKLVFTQ